jgi:hypothetical protein
LLSLALSIPDARPSGLAQDCVAFGSNKESLVQDRIGRTILFIGRVLDLTKSKIK